MKKDAISPVAPYVLILIGIAAVSTASILIRFAQVYASSITIAAFRLGLAALLLLPYTLYGYSSELKSFSRSDLGFTLLAGFFLAIHFGVWITSLEFTTVANSVVLVTTTPLWVSLMAPIFLRERTPRIAFLGMFIALLGGVIIAFSNVCTWFPAGVHCSQMVGFFGTRSLFGDFLALLGAIAAAAYLMIGRHIRRKVSLTPYVFLVYSAAGFFLVLAMLIIEGIPPIYPTRVYGWLIALAVVPQLVGHSIFNWSLKYLPTGYVSINLLGEPIGTIILAYIFLSETPSGVKLIGAILILAGIGITSFYQQSQPQV
jgi:drug/metabolite transporter (DMT)-like permease